MSPSPSVERFEDDFLATREVGGVCVAMIDERIITDHQVEAVKHRLYDLADAHAGRMAISLFNTDGSSMGLFAGLVQVERRCARYCGRMVLFNVPDETSRLLSSFGLLDRFIIGTDLEQALDLVRGTGGAGRSSWLSQVLAPRRSAA